MILGYRFGTSSESDEDDDDPRDPTYVVDDDDTSDMSDDEHVTLDELIQQITPTCAPTRERVCDNKPYSTITSTERHQPSEDCASTSACTTDSNYEHDSTRRPFERKLEGINFTGIAF